MRVVIAPPPNYALLCSAFNIANRRDIIYCYGDAIWNPHNVPVTPALMAHETVHSERQGDRPDRWWQEYIEDRHFRFLEEMLAHQAEYRVLAESATSRNHRRIMQRDVARKLAAPLYGGLVHEKQAFKMVTARNLLEMPRYKEDAPMRFEDAA